MKLLIRAFAMFIVFVGLAAASLSSATPPSAQNRFAPTAKGSLGLLDVPTPPCLLCQ